MVQRWGDRVHMNRGRVGEERGSKEKDGCCQGTPVAYPPVTGQGHLNECGSAKAGWVSSATPAQRHAVSDIYTTDHNRLPSVDCDAFGLTANVLGIKVWVIPLQMSPYNCMERACWSSWTWWTGTSFWWQSWRVIQLMSGPFVISMKGCSEKDTLDARNAYAKHELAFQLESTWGSIAGGALTSPVTYSYKQLRESPMVTSSHHSL
jgi:hypothetical protein